MEETKKNIKKTIQWNKIHRLQNKTSKKIRKHTYSNQTNEVKKRMRQSLKSAENYNRGKTPLRVKLSKLISNG